ncbi:MAG: carboxypeptidase-like regulatory domain-containing protein [Pseudomonadota bacterium]
MKPHHAIWFCSLLFFASILIVPLNTLAQPAVSGKVFLSAPSGPVPLSGAIVRLVSNDPARTRHTYTDSRGLFALYDIEAGTYEIQIVLGNRIMKQKVNDGFATTRLINVSGSSLKIPDIFVTPD